MLKKNRQRLLMMLGIIACLVSLYIVIKYPYLLGWLVRRFFLFLWVPILITWRSQKKTIATTLALGTFFGIPLGQLVENLKSVIYGNTNQGNSISWGLPFYLMVILASVIVGLLLEYRKKA